jgi:hypothetical protein
MFSACRSLHGTVAVALGLALVVSGCGTSSYNALMGRRLSALRGAAKFQGLYAATEIPDSPFRIRVPIAFEHSYQTASAHDDDGGPINPDRLQPPPPLPKIPGFKLAYEGQVEVGDTRQPFYCYLGVVPAQPGDVDKVTAQLLAQVKKVFPTASDTWQPIDADTPEGKSLRWRTLKAEGEQPFLVKTGDKVAPQNMPGIFELWVHDAETHLVIVGWRAPAAINAPSEVTIVDPLQRPANMKPDLATMPAKTAGTLTQAEAAP